MPVEGDGGEFAMARTGVELVLAEVLGLDNAVCDAVQSYQQNCHDRHR
jgi:hypothetical protein